MKAAIIGTRGIPNNYGGFEQFAEYLSEGLAKRGHEIAVYSPHNHTYTAAEWKGVKLIHKFDPEYLIGTAGQFIYDLNCILDSRLRKFDVLLNLGYTSSSVWNRFFPANSVLITNMDGLEWRRTKYSKKVQNFLKYAEALAVKRSDMLVSDSPGIREYLTRTYNRDSTFIPYGADKFVTPEIEVLQAFEVGRFAYNMLIARMEPENNIETILDGVHSSGSTLPFLVIGNFQNVFGTYLKEKFSKDSRIRFLGPIYDIRQINNLRHFCYLYFHGHSVGGTNPSLLEAMACGALIASHDNEFNRHVLNESALYFRNSSDVKELISRNDLTEKREQMAAVNYLKIETTYSWKKIIDQYEELMLNSMTK